MRTERSCRRNHAMRREREEGEKKQRVLKAKASLRQGEPRGTWAWSAGAKKNREHDGRERSTCA
eukprot:5254286-Pleurochrysis_carterae.AAC.2